MRALFKLKRPPKHVVNSRADIHNLTWSNFFETSSAAVMSKDKRYRYVLARQWNVNGPTCAFLMLNPSTADHKRDDPTIAKVIGFAQRWGFGRVLVCNLFALRATDPAGLYEEQEDPVGSLNNAALLHAMGFADRRPGGSPSIICGWGTHGSYMGRDREVLEALHGHELYALGTNLDGSPKHPLYVPYKVTPVCYN